MFEDTTFLIKTFARPKEFKDCVESLAHVAPGARVIVCDDSKKPYAQSILKDTCLDWSIAPSYFDMGISCGRNSMVRQVDTEFLFLLDDDYVFHSSQPLMGALNEVREDRLDIAALPLRNRWTNEIQVCHENISFVNDAIVCTKTKDPYGYADQVNNCFAARTDIIKNLLWDGVLKVTEHVDFAIRAKRMGLRSRTVESHGVIHQPSRSRKGYRRYRGRSYISLMLHKFDKQCIVRSNGKRLRIKPLTNYPKAKRQMELRESRGMR